jgi:predicted metal-dependent phosphotriesterase family hydrolase
MRIIRTVRGDIGPSQLGITAPHEHLWCDQEIEDKYAMYSFPGISEKMYMRDRQLVIKELQEFHQAGGRAVAEMTSDGWGRDVTVLKEISEAASVHVISVSGTYIDEYLPQYFYRMDIDELAEWFAREITVGVDGTGIRTGLLKTSVSRRVVEQAEEKGARAVARAQLKTGVAITTHTNASSRFEIKGGNSGMLHLDIFEQEGVDLSRVIVGHTDENADLRQLIQLIKRGASIQFDTIGKLHWQLDETRIGLIRQLCEKGYEDRLLLSTDRCRVSETKTFGGPGYSHILNTFVPMLRRSGIDEKIIHKFLVDNPAAIFSFEVG